MSKMDIRPKMDYDIFSVDNENSEAKGEPMEHAGFNPYVMNNGTVAAVAGKDFCKVVGDTRCSQGFLILSRDLTKITKLTETCVIATAGMRADAIALHKRLQTHIKIYERKFKKVPDISAIAQFLANTLYGRRFFPYYTFNLLCGLDSEGKGAIYGYDAVGSYDRVNCGGMGSGSEIVIPMLDNQIKDHNVLNPEAPSDEGKIENLLRDAMHATCERDIYTGDSLDIVTIDKDGVKFMNEPLRRD